MEKTIKESILIKEPWVGFIHNVPHHPEIINSLYGNQHNWDLQRIVESDVWKANLKFCKGIFCLSTENFEFLKDNLPSTIMLEMVYHTTEIPSIKFDFNKFLNNKNKKVVLVGHWMRNFQGIFDLSSIYPKFILRGSVDAFRYDKIPLFYNSNNSVSYIEKLENKEYDSLLSENIVFLNLYGSSANNTVVECIARNTPIVVNRLKSLEDYLGKDYPLFYDDLSEASRLIEDNKAIGDAVEHMKGLKKIEPSYFLESVANSKIYKSINLVGFI